MLKVTCALIVKNGKLLITRNGPESDHALQWEFPGGKVKLAETEVACIVREIKEELELNIKVIVQLKAIEHDYGIKKIRLIPFICEITGGILKLNNHIEKKWITTDELCSIDFSEADKRFVQKRETQQILKKYAGK